MGNSFLFRRKTWLIFSVVLIVAFVGGVGFFSSKYETLISDEGSYEPKDDAEKGLIGKSNSLLSLAKAIRTEAKEDADVLLTLHKRYPALRFALPEGVDGYGCYYEDVRLVGINDKLLFSEDSLKAYAVNQDDREKILALRDFYYNSQLPLVLEKQNADRISKYFRMNLRLNQKEQLELKRVRIDKSHFKVPLQYDIWQGHILGNSNKIFKDNSLYLDFEGMVIPLYLDAQKKEMIAESSHKIELREGSPVKFNGTAFALEDYYQYAYVDHKRDFVGIRVIDPDASCDIYIHARKEKGGEIFLDCCAHNANGFDRSQMVVTWSEFERIDTLNREIKSFELKRDGKFMVMLPNKKVCEFNISTRDLMNELSYIIHSNKGIARYSVDPKITDLYTQQLLQVVLFEMREKKQDKINLSIDYVLSKYLEGELTAYLETLKKSHWYKAKLGDKLEISMSIINTKTGEILALPYATDAQVDTALILSRKNPNMIRRYVGSAFKPLLTTAAALYYPKLADFVLTPSMKVVQDKKGLLLGCPIAMDPKTGKLFASEHWKNKGNVSMTQFFGESHDVYPVALTMFALTPGLETKLPTLITNGKLGNYLLSLGKSEFIVPKKGNTYLNTNTTVNAIPFLSLLNTLYGVDSKSNEQTEEDENDTYMWRLFQTDKDNRYLFPQISPEFTNMNYTTWIKDEKNNYAEQSFRGSVVPWVLGQGTNEWSPVKFAESWARMITKQKVTLSILQYDQLHYPKTLLESLSNEGSLLGERKGEKHMKEANKAWNKVLNALLQSQKISKNIQISDKIKIEAHQGDSLYLLGKTGTPNNYVRKDYESYTRQKRVYDVGLFTFSLLRKSAYQKITGDLAKYTTEFDQLEGLGITCVIRIVHTYDASRGGDDLRQGVDKGGVWGYTARDFINDENRLEHILFYTQNLFKKNIE